MESMILHKRNGEVTNRKAFEKFIEDAEDGMHELRRRSLRKRSLSQNSFFHAILPDILQGLRDKGYDEIENVEDAKYLLKMMFLKKTVVDRTTGEVHAIPLRTRDQTKEQMSEFIDKVIRFAAEYLGVVIFSPGEQSQFFNSVALATHDNGVTIIQSA